MGLNVAADDNDFLILPELVGVDQLGIQPRYCSPATPGQVMISHKTYAHLNGELPVRDMGEIQVKGFEKAVKVYEIELPFE